MNVRIPLLILTVNIVLSPCIIAMSNDEQLVQETNQIFNQACKDFNIAPESIALTVTLHEGKSIYGSAQTIAKKILIERGRNASPAAIEFNMYHEVAHLADKSLVCYQKIIKPMLLTATSALLYGIGAVHYRYVMSSGMGGRTKAVGATVFALGAGGLAVGLAHFIHKQMIYQSEYRADYQACEQLLKRKSYRSIMEYYCMLSASRVQGKRKLDSTHPTIESEMSNIQTCLTHNGYRIAVAQALAQNTYQLSLYKHDTVIGTMKFRVLGNK